MNLLKYLRFTRQILLDNLKPLLFLALLVMLGGFIPDKTFAITNPSLVLDANQTVQSGSYTSSMLFNGKVYMGISTQEYGNEIWVTDGTAEGTHIFIDIVKGGSFTPLFIATTSDYLFFRGTTPEYGTELWVTDGTVEGTRMVKDIAPGVANGVTSSISRVLGSTIYFMANDSTHGSELWKSDGTEVGTVGMDFYTGAGSAYVSGQIRAIGSSLFFFGNDNGAGGSIIKSDGTQAGTASLGTYPTLTTNLTEIGSYIYTNGDDDVHGRELWRTDGTALGTFMVKDIYEGSTMSFPSSITNIDGTNFYFTATDATNGTELWKSDGTEVGTVLIKDINPGTANSSASSLRKMGSAVYFNATDGTNGFELWKTDGTAEGTVLVKDILPGSSSSQPSNLIVLGSDLYFTADDSFTGVELWKSDGTAEGTVLVKDINPSGPSSPTSLFVFGNHIYFRASDGVNGTEFWRTDGTTEGTVMIKDIEGNQGSLATLSAASNNSSLIFRMATTSTNYEIWKTDGTEGGTTFVRDIRPGSTGSGTTDPMLKVGDITYIVANDGTTGIELWKTDGTEGGTVLVKDIRSGISNSSPANLTALGSTLIFTANDGTNGTELWKSDGTTGGTVLLKDIYSGSTASSPKLFMTASSSLFFFATNSTNGEELWRTDGTAEGTYMVKDIYSGSNGGVLSRLYLSNYAMGSSTAFFTAYAGAQTGLWRTDGTPDGTFVVKEFLNNGEEAIRSIVVAGNTVFFMAQGDEYDGVISDYDLWKSDGTTAGTVFIKDLDGGSSINAGEETYESYTMMTAGDSRVYFAVEKPDTGFELWISDGTATGTYMIQDTYQGVTHGLPLLTGHAITQPLVIVGDVAFFHGRDEDHGAELWKTDGTEEGTFVLDIFPGEGSSAPNQLLVTNNETELYMMAASSNIGSELMRISLTPTTTLSSITTSSISKTGATVSTSITDVGFSPAHTRGFNYGTSLAYGMSTTTEGRYSLSTHEYTLSDLTCNTTYYVQAFAVNTYGTTTQTTSFTTSACDAVVTPSSSRRGGGGSRISVPVTPTSTTPLSTLVVPPTSSSNTTTFTRDLSFGSTGTDVIALQRFLNSRGFTVSTTGPGSPGNEINVFGSRTQAALARFQTSVGITPASGYFGPITRSFVNALGAPTQIAPAVPATPTQPTAPQTTTSPSNNTTTYTRDLFLGSRGSDVTALQNFLIQQGYLESGYATGYFGQLTQAALIKFQQANNISPALGYFGSKTRGVVGK